MTAARVVLGGGVRFMGGPLARPLVVELTDAQVLKYC